MQIRKRNEEGMRRDHAFCVDDCWILLFKIGHSHYSSVGFFISVTQYQQLFSIVQQINKKSSHGSIYHVEFTKSMNSKFHKNLLQALNNYGTLNLQRDVNRGISLSPACIHFFVKIGKLSCPMYFYEFATDSTKTTKSGTRNGVV